MTVHVVTANRLEDGAVIYLAGDGGWSERIGASRLAEGKEEGEAMLAEAERAIAERKVVAPYLIDVVVDGDDVRPTRFRERIRAYGPPVHPQFAKQARRG
ncbi:MAG: DUF2849 domain-containing protein [Rhodospirillales bacterium]